MYSFSAGEKNKTKHCADCKGTGKMLGFLNYEVPDHLTTILVPSVFSSTARLTIKKFISENGL